MPASPLVSIIMNCYNGEQYLREAIESVLSQTYQDWELIFWDNRSTDKSEEIFKSYDDGRFKYYYAPKHTLLYEARNYAIEKASGEFYAFLDVDDWWVPGKLDKQMVLFQDSEVALVYSNYWIVNSLNNTKMLKSKSPLKSGMIRSDLLKNYDVGIATVVVRKNIFSGDAEIFNPQYNIIGDLDMVVRLAQAHKIDVVQEPLAFFRWHLNNTTKLNTKLYSQELWQWCKELRKNKINNNNLWSVYFLVVRINIYVLLKYIGIK